MAYNATLEGSIDAGARREEELQASLARAENISTEAAGGN
jgi:hypothetical protein